MYELFFRRRTRHENFILIAGQEFNQLHEIIKTPFPAVSPGFRVQDQVELSGVQESGYIGRQGRQPGQPIKAADLLRSIEEFPAQWFQQLQI